MMFKAVCICFVLQMLLDLEVAQGCTERGVEDCTNPILLIPRETTEAVVPTYSEANFDKFCGERGGVERCLRNLGCGTAEKLVLDTLFAEWRYYCGDKQGYHDAKICFEDEDIIRGAKICVDRLGNTKAQTNEALCGDVKEFENCLLDTTSSCSQRQKTWTKQYVKEANAPTRKFLKCGFTLMKASVSLMMSVLLMLVALREY